MAGTGMSSLAPLFKKNFYLAARDTLFAAGEDIMADGLACGCPANHCAALSASRKAATSLADPFDEESPLSNGSMYEAKAYRGVESESAAWRYATGMSCNWRSRLSNSSILLQGRIGEFLRSSGGLDGSDSDHPP